MPQQCTNIPKKQHARTTQPCQPSSVPKRANAQRSDIRPCAHGLYFSIFFVGMWTQNVPALMMGLVLDLFAAHEVFLYLVLIGYRLRLDARFTNAMLWLGCGWDALTRVVETAVLATMIIGRTPAFLFTTVLCGDRHPGVHARDLSQHWQAPAQPPRGCAGCRHRRRQGARAA